MGQPRNCSKHQARADAKWFRLERTQATHKSCLGWRRKQCENLKLQQYAFKIEGQCAQQPDFPSLLWNLHHLRLLCVVPSLPPIIPPPTPAQASLESWLISSCCIYSYLVLYRKQSVLFWITALAWDRAARQPMQTSKWGVLHSCCNSGLQTL